MRTLLYRARMRLKASAMKELPQKLKAGVGLETLLVKKLSISAALPTVATFGSAATPCLTAQVNLLAEGTLTGIGRACARTFRADRHARKGAPNSLFGGWDWASRR